MRSALAILAIVALAALAAGCGPTRTPAPASAATAPATEAALPVLGPQEVLAAHNAWADGVRTVWSRAAVLINFAPPGPGERPVRHDLEGHLFIEKPDRLLLHGQVLGQEVFKLGMNPERFWLWVRPQVNTVWTGARGGEGEKAFVLSPADLMAALGMSRIDIGPDTPPGSFVFIALPEHYVLAQQRMVADMWLPVRRTWFDRRTLRPVRIDLFGDGGRRLLMAELMHYEPAGDTQVCTVYRARFTGDQPVAMVLRLSKVDLAKPLNPRLFEYAVPPGAEVKDLDKGEGGKAGMME
jgi:hypothetical protein